MLQIVLCNFEFFSQFAEGVALLNDVGEWGCGWDGGVDDDDRIWRGCINGGAGKVWLQRPV